MNLVSVYNAEDESVAEIVNGLLQGEGIPSVIHCEESPVLEGVLDPAADAWGQILVPESEADHAREVIAAYAGGGGDGDA